jgi:hypothetical protein
VFLTTSAPDVKKIPFYDHVFASKDDKNTFFLTMHIVPWQCKNVSARVFYSLQMLKNAFLKLCELASTSCFKLQEHVPSDLAICLNSSELDFNYSRLKKYLFMTMSLLVC